MLYFDNNATTSPAPGLAEYMAGIMETAWGNPSSSHAIGRKARRVLEDSREQIAHRLCAHPDELVFTSGGTESNNLAIRGLTAGRSGTIAHGAGDHPATIETCRALGMQDGLRVAVVPVRESGRFVRPEEATLDRDSLRIVTLLAAHNETGVIQDAAPWAEWCRRHQIPLHLDVVQLIGKLPFHFHESGAASASFGAHKFHGPRGIGGLLLRKGSRLTAQLTGGFQESGRRGGTEAVAIIAGMAWALERWHDAQSNTEHSSEAVGRRRDRLQRLLVEHASPAIVFGDSGPRLPNTLNIAFPGIPAETLLVQLDLLGLACSAGSACASGAFEPSPIHLAMGIPTDIAKSTIRLSLSRYTTDADVDAAFKIITQTLGASKQP